MNKNVDIKIDKLVLEFEDILDAASDIAKDEPDINPNKVMDPNTVVPKIDVPEMGEGNPYSNPERDPLQLLLKTKNSEK